MPTWKDRLRDLSVVARERAAAARVVAQEQTARGKTLAEEKLAARRAQREAAARWWETETGAVHTHGYPTPEAMRDGVTAAATHGWTAARMVEGERTGTMPLGGITGYVAQQVRDRLQPADRYLVTFRRAETAPPPPKDASAT